MRISKKKSKSVTTKPAPATPTKADQGISAIATAPDLLPREFIRSEVNFLTLPFFALRDKDVHERTETTYKDVVNRNGQRLEIEWNVSANPKYGYPGVFDRKVHKAIEQIICNLPHPIQNPIPLGSLYRIAQLLNLRDSGQVYRDIKSAIQRIVTTSIESKGTFSDKGRRRWREATFHLYDKVFFTGEELDNGEIADTNYLFVDSWYLDNVNSRYTKPLDYTYYRSLKSNIASRLYELLGVKFYGNPYIRYRYSTLCQLLPATQYQYLSKAKEKLKRAHEELISTDFLNKVEWDTIQGESHDWYVYYWAGTRAIEEIQRWSKQALHQNGTGLAALPPPDDLGDSPQPAPANPTEQVADDVVNALQKFGITKKIAHKLAKDYPEDYIITKLDLVKYLVGMQSPLVSKNPQGFLIHAIQDDYPMPPQYKSQKQEEARDSEEQEARLAAQEEYRKAKEQARQLVLEQHPPQPIAGTEHTTQSAWSKVLASLKEQVSPATFTGWLKDTLLLRVEQNTAFVLVTNRMAQEWLERRLYGTISRSLEQVLGQPVEVEFVANEPSS